MTTSFTNRVRIVLAAGLLALLGGCQSFNGMVAYFKPGGPNPSSVAAETPPPAPITKERKLDVQMAVARSCENDGNTEQAIQVYQEVVKKDSRRAEAYHRLAILYDLKGDPQKAHEYYTTAIQKAPKNADLYCDLGYSCYLQRNWAEAEVNLRKALEERPGLARAHTNLGLLLGRTDHATEALAEFSQAGCDEAAARCNLAFALTLEEHGQEARQQYELALAANPNAAAAKQGLAALQAHWPDGDPAPRPGVPGAPAPQNVTPPPTVQAAFVAPDVQRF